MSNYSGLQIVEKKYNNVGVGFVVGWWVNVGWKWGSRKRGFRSVREGVSFETLDEAKTFRTAIESIRNDTANRIDWVEVKDL